MKLVHRVLIGLSLLLLMSQNSWASCQGKFPNPVTDVCWSCIFPITIGSWELPFGGKEPNPPSSKAASPVCSCPRPPYVGLRIGLWEVSRLVEVVRTPYCFPGLGGIEMPAPLKRYHGVVDAASSGENTSKYHVHYYIFPLLYLMELLDDFMCLDNQGLDLAYISELDPTANNSVLAAILSPESVLFANPVAQAAAIVDCTSSSAGLPIDALFWTAGCAGSIFPLTTDVQAHVSGHQASSLLTQRVLFKMHRIGALRGSTGELALCNSVPMPIWRKSQYRLSPVYPIPANAKEPFPCNPVGRTSTVYETGREYPIKGEDFVLMVWRKRECCAL